MTSNRKNTRLFYRDEKSIEFWNALPSDMVKELLLGSLEYEYGEEIPERFNNNPILKALFIQLKEKIDFNEAKWKNDKRKTTAVENGKKGGRPKKVQVENEIVDTETGEIITEDLPEDLMRSLRDTPQEIRNLISDKYPEQYLELRSMFLDKHDDSEKPQLNERFNELCRMYDIEPDKNSKRIIKGVIEEFDDRISERKALEKQIETIYSSSEEVVEELSEETDEPVDSEKESIIVAYLNDRPWIMKQGQSYQCFKMCTPSVYDFMYEKGISENEFERVYKRIVSVR